MWYEDYENLIPPAHRYPLSAPYATKFDPENDGVERSRFAQFVMLCCQQGIDMGRMIEGYLVDFDLENAVGKQLEAIAALLGVERKLPFDVTDPEAVLSDDDLRLLIRARIAINTWDGTNEGLTDILRNIFAQYSVSFMDGQDMTMHYTIRSKFTEMQQNMCRGDMIFPRPTGVAVDFTFMDTAEETSISTNSLLVSDFQRSGMNALENENGGEP